MRLRKAGKSNNLKKSVSLRVLCGVLIIQEL